LEGKGELCPVQGREGCSSSWRVVGSEAVDVVTRKYILVFCEIEEVCGLCNGVLGGIIRLTSNKHVTTLMGRWLIIASIVVVNLFRN
jgi:hypothetical protein